MHNIFMRKPRHEFHDTEGEEKSKDPIEDLHGES